MFLSVSTFSLTIDVGLSTRPFPVRIQRQKGSRFVFGTVEEVR